MANDLSRIIPICREGKEPFHMSGRGIDCSVLDFWRWSASNLLSNSTRGVLAEFIVAKALGVDLSMARDEWGAYDLVTPEGITVEVKSAAYIQSWHQDRMSSISFRISETKEWSADKGKIEKDSKRQAQVYVFALLAHQDKHSVDPLNVDQWSFYVLSTKTLNDKASNQKTISLSRIRSLAETEVDYTELRTAVLQSASQ